MSEYLLECDNVATCRSMIPMRDTVDQTIARARAGGWHLFAGTTQSGKFINVVLCPTCIGTPRSRLAPAPQNLEGQLDLFEEDEPVADVQEAFDEGTKFETRKPE